MKVTIRHGATLQCDAPRCKARFTSYSVASIVREQAALMGWARVPAWQIEGLADSPRLKKDVCAVHAAKALEIKAERPKILAAERAKAKAERAELRCAQREVKLAIRAQKKLAARSAKRSAVAAEKVVRKADRKARKLEAKVRGARVHVAGVP